MSVYMRFGPLWAGELGNSTHNTTNCPGGVHWMLKYLGACARSPQEQASEYLGLLSMILWMMVGLPQIIKNFRNLDGMAGISFFLLFQWAGGDITNLVGSLLTHQLPFQIYLAIYFVFIDAILLVQYTAYRMKRMRNGRSNRDSAAERRGTAASRVVLCLMGVLFCSQMVLPSSSRGADGLANFEPVSGGHLSRALLSVSKEDGFEPIAVESGPLFFKPEFGRGASTLKREGAKNLLESLLGTSDDSFWHNKRDIIGYAIGIVSSIFYLGSRTAQIIKNIKKKSTEGLSFLMFALAVLGNLAYGLQILVHSVEKEFLLEKTPWLVGSLGVIGLDCTLLAQFYHYQDKRGVTEDMKRSLINSEVIVSGALPSNGPSLTAATDVEHGTDDQRALIY